MAAVLFYVQRNNYLNQDARAFAKKFPKDEFREIGAHVTHDEIWELYLHSKFWYLTRDAFGWSLVHSYQVLSCVAGGVFVYIVLSYAPRLSKSLPLVATCALFSGGFTQLFFGDVENYTLNATWLMLYFLTSAMYLERKVVLWVPSSVLAVAMTFHLQSGFVGPSLIYLGIVGLRRREFLGVAVAVVGTLAILGGTLAFFDYIGLPSEKLFRSHAFAGGKSMSRMIASTSWSYYGDIANLLLLLSPCLVLLAPLAYKREFYLDPIGIHLLISSIMVLLFSLTWKAKLGVYDDWNLFAVTGIPVSLFVWRSVFRVVPKWRSGAPIYLFIALSCCHTLCWVFSRHELIPA